MKTFLRRLFAPSPSRVDASQLEELQRRCAALEHALDEQRSVTRAILYAMGRAPIAYRERARRDLTVALAKGRDAVPLALLEPFEEGCDAWHDESGPQRARRA